MLLSNRHYRTSTGAGNAATGREAVAAAPGANTGSSTSISTRASRAVPALAAVVVLQQ